MLKHVMSAFIALICLGALAETPSELASDTFLPPLEIDENESSRQILEEFFELISTRWSGGYSEEFEKMGDAKVENIEKEFDAKLLKAEVRLLELQNLINSQPEYAPYFSSFYFRQISDLKESFEKILTALETYHRNAKHDRDELFNSMLMVENLNIVRPELNWCKDWIRSHVQPMLKAYESWLTRMDCLLARGQTFKKSLEEVYRQEEREIQSNYENYYTHRFPFLGYTRGDDIATQVRIIALSFDEWRLSLPVIIRVILPDKTFHVTMLRILILAIALSFVVGALLRRASRVLFLRFRRAYLFACLGGYFMTCVFFLPSTNDIIVFTLAGFFLTLAAVDAAWRLRKRWTHSKGKNPFFIVVFTFAVIDMFVSMHAPVHVVLTVTFLGSLTSLAWIFFIFSVWKYPTSERVFGGGILGCASILSSVAAWLGYLYPAMLTLIVTGLCVCLLYAGSVFTQAIVEKAGKLAHRRLFASFIFTLMVPLLWLGLLLGALRWGGQIFNAGRILQLVYNTDLFPSVDIDISLKAILFLVLIALFTKFILNWIKHMLEVFSGERKFDTGSLSSAFLIFQYCVWTIYIVYMLNSFHIDWKSIQYVLGGLSVGLGFALKELLENFVCGIILLIGKEVRPGDVVEFDGTHGIVEQINIRATVIKTYDNAIITLPNNQVVSKDFRNWTVNGHVMRRQLDLKLPYEVDFTKAADLMKKAMNECPSVMKFRDPEVLFQQFGEHAMEFRLRFWINVEDWTTAPSQVRERVGAVFRENGLAFALPKLEVQIPKEAVAGAG